MTIYQIIPGLFQSGLVYDHDAVVAKGIRLVVDLSDSVLLNPGENFDLIGFPIIRWHIEDCAVLPDQNVLFWVGGCVLNSFRKGLPVLCHCTGGINRSGLVNGLVLYLAGLGSGKEVVAKVQSAVPGALTNQTFVSFLENLP